MVSQKKKKKKSFDCPIQSHGLVVNDYPAKKSVNINLWRKKIIYKQKPFQ